MATPFFAVYASRELAPGPEMVSVYLAFNLAASLVSNLLWSRLSDWRGNRAVIRLAAGLGLMMALLAWLSGPLDQMLDWLLSRHGCLRLCFLSWAPSNQASGWVA